MGGPTCSNVGPRRSSTTAATPPSIRATYANRAQVGDPAGVWTELDVPPQVRVIDALVTVYDDGEATAGTIGRVGHTTRIRTEYGRADLLDRGAPPVVDIRRDSPVDSSDLREPSSGRRPGWSLD